MTKLRIRRPIAAIALVFILGGCGGGGESSTPSPTPAPAPTPTPPPAQTFTVAFDANGSEGTAPPVTTFTVGQAFTLPRAELSVIGYTFAGWSTNPDGSGTVYAPEASVTLSAPTLLYAQFKAKPLKITQTGNGGEARITVEWGNGTRQEFAYSPDNVGFAIGQQLNGVVGGWALLVQGAPAYHHTNEPSAYRGPVRMTVEAGASSATLNEVMVATSPRSADRSGSLAANGATTNADEIRVTVRGRIRDAEADSMVELTLRADAPQMALARAHLVYTRPTQVVRLYHQMAHGDPSRLTGTITYLSVKDAQYVDAPALPPGLNDGLFIKSDNGFYTGFAGPRAPADDLESFRDGAYFAAYKTMYSNRLLQAGDDTRSRAVATWGVGIADARKLLFWSEILRAGVTTPQPETYADRGLIRMVTASYAPN